MTDFDLAAILAEIAGQTPMTLVEPGSPEAALVPEPWRAIASSADPAIRASAALALWNPEFLALVPRFAEVFRARLEDVRVCRLQDDWVLLYLAGHPVESHVTWIGWEPGDHTRAPFWEAIPLPARDFLTGVHAGFTGPDWQSYGLMPPKWMQIFAEWAEFDDETIEEWNAEWTVGVDRMTLVTANGSLLYHCVSPDAPGRMVLVYEGDVDDRPEFGEALDELMSERFAV